MITKAFNNFGGPFPFMYSILMLLSTLSMTPMLVTLGIEYVDSTLFSNHNQKKPTDTPRIAPIAVCGMSCKCDRILQTLSATQIIVHMTRITAQITYKKPKLYKTKHT